jgi:tRNA nucleotidyltransferase (CCA-adding enzyme)
MPILRPMTSTNRSAAQLRDDLLCSLPDAACDAIGRIVAHRDAGGVFAVGGAVRDLLLGAPLVDVDLVTECDAIDTVTAAMPDVRVTTHARFRTASLTVEGVRVDVATARTETYARPGALPRVAPGRIADDLRRRDFSINAIALRLDGPAELLDPCDGIADLAAHRIRVLHERSFLDDATRIYRALRYAARLGFEIAPATTGLVRLGVRYLDTIGSERLRRELELVLEEPSAGDALEACASWGALGATHRALHWDAERSSALAHPPVPALPRIALGFALLAATASADDAAGICTRLRLKRAENASVRGVVAVASATAMLRRSDVKPSGVVMLLDRYPPAAVAAYAATCAGSIAAPVALRYLEEWRHVRPLLNGRDLLDLGVPEGPQVQRGLQLIRAARLDGWAGDRDDERALAMRYVKSIRDSSAASAPGDPQLDET